MRVEAIRYLRPRQWDRFGVASVSSNKYLNSVTCNVVWFFAFFLKHFPIFTNCVLKNSLPPSHPTSPRLLFFPSISPLPSLFTPPPPPHIPSLFFTHSLYVYSCVVINTGNSILWWQFVGSGLWSGCYGDLTVEEIATLLSYHLVTKGTSLYPPVLQVHVELSLP